MNNSSRSMPSPRFTKKPLAILFATLLMTSQAQVVLGETHPADAFYNDTYYTYCDINLLSAYWGQSRYDSKVRAGNKILRNEHYVVEDYLRSARDYALEHNVRCSFADADNPRYTYEDAVTLADFWGKPTPYDAKLKIGSMLQQGDNKLVGQALRNARNGS